MQDLPLGRDTGGGLGSENGRSTMDDERPSAHEGKDHAASQSSHGSRGRPYLMFWLNMGLGLFVMYVVMFSMIDTRQDFRNNLNMFYMAVTMWAPMGIFMLATMPGMYRSRGMNAALYVLFALLTVGSFVATRTQTAIDDRQFVASMVPHHSGAILMCRQARLSDPELVTLCSQIARTQREEIDQMNRIAARLR
jgi:hypothetical protein